VDRLLLGLSSSAAAFLFIANVANTFYKVGGTGFCFGFGRSLFNLL
jgi:hypothetical protein